MKCNTNLSSLTIRAFGLLQRLQGQLVSELEKTRVDFDNNQSTFESIEWLRNDGKNGGGERFVATDQQAFNRASVNLSQVHYIDDASKSMQSATALSTIVHPYLPLAPSLHMHLSWTELKNGYGFWRMMADLNPSTEDSSATVAFIQSLKNAAPEQFDQAAKQGDQYFYIPALERHRGVAHFYLENYHSGDDDNDFMLAQSIGESVIKCYSQLVKTAVINHLSPTADDFTKQRDYHTLYLFQVLTLDKGTTSGLLVHDQNDVGVLGSLPAYINRPLLASWLDKLPIPQNKLLENILSVLPESFPCLVDDTIKQKLADVVREHYQTHPEAIKLQAGIS